MLGILIALVISWVLLWLFERKDLSALGITPSSGRLIDLLFGFGSAFVCACLYFFSLAWFSKSQIEINPGYTKGMFAAASWWIFKSVLFEELVFRGALLFIAIRKMGMKTACVLSAIAFAIYHWFSYGIVGNPIQMTYVFFLTGIAGALFALSFAITRSLYLPTGLHLGWNLVSIILFSQGPLGKQWLTLSGGHIVPTFISLILLLIQVLVLPLITFFYLKRFHRGGFPANPAELLLPKKERSS